MRTRQGACSRMPRGAALCPMPIGHWRRKASSLPTGAPQRHRARQGGGVAEPRSPFVVREVAHPHDAAPGNAQRSDRIEFAFRALFLFLKAFKKWLRTHAEY